MHDPIAIPFLERARQLVETIVIDSLERIANEEAVRVLILALTRLPNDENILVRSSLERVRGNPPHPGPPNQSEPPLPPSPSRNRSSRAILARDGVRRARPSPQAF